MTLHTPIATKFKHIRRVRCYFEGCRNFATLLCDKTLPPVEDKPPACCSRACCPQHARWWKDKSHLCLEHAEEEGLFS